MLNVLEITIAGEFGSKLLVLEALTHGNTVRHIRNLVCILMFLRVDIQIKVYLFLLIHLKSSNNLITC